MFIVFGILSILAAVFVYNQSSKLVFLSSLVNNDNMSAVSGAFVITAVLMLIAGILACACNGGKKRGMLKGSVFFHILTVLVCCTELVGDLQIWAIANGVVAIIYIIWMLSHKKDSTPAQ